MKLYLVEYQVQFKDGKEVLTIKDKLVVPAKSEKGAQATFMKSVAVIPNLLMCYSSELRILAPVRDLGGTVSVLSCSKV